MNAIIRMMVLLIAAMLGASPALAQDRVGVSARVSSAQAYVGDPIELEIIVDGTTDATAPDLQDLDGFEVEYRGDENRSMTSMSIVNGRRSQSESLQYVFKYSLTPTREGQLSVPPVVVTANGKPHSTQQVWIEAKAAQTSDDFIITAEPETNLLYVGQPVAIRFTWYIGGQHDGRVRFWCADAGGGYTFSAGPDPRTISPGGDPGRYQEFQFLDGPAVGEWRTGSLSGRSYQTFTFSQILIPQRAGSIRFGPVSLGFGQIVGPRGDTLFFRPETRRVVIATDAVDLEVSELPPEGRPSDFTGLVGDYAILVSASPTSASVGDPIGLTVRLHGPEPMEGVAAPDLTQQKGFAGSFKLASDGWTQGKPSAPGERVFNTTVRATHAGVSAIPAIEVPYFDPGRAEYRRAESAPIPVSIRATSEVTAADAIVAMGQVGSPEASGPRLSALERVPLGEGPVGVVEGQRGPALLTASEPDAIGWIRSPLGLAVMGAPLAAFLVAAAAAPMRRAWAAPHRRALARAGASIRRALIGDRPADAIGAAVRGYIGRMTGRPPEALTARDCAALIGERAPSGAAAIQALLEECEGVRYGRRVVEPAVLARRAVESLAQLDAELRRRA